MSGRNGGQFTGTVLRYDFDAVITGTEFRHSCFDRPDMIEECAYYESRGHRTTYDGPAIATRGAGWIALDIKDYLAEYDEYELTLSYSILGLPLRGYRTTWIGRDQFNTLTNVADLAFASWDDFFSATLNLDRYMPSWGFLSWEVDEGQARAAANFSIGNARVTDLTEQPAPVPLPAGLLLLPAALGGLALVRRRRARG